MSSWSAERRLNLAAEGDERRKHEAFRATLRRDERRADKDERRADKAQQRRDRSQRRQARAAKREKTLTPGNVYRKGTLILVALSALASLPAQIIHFVSISWMLLPIGPALEGAAWVMAAGVAYADERKLPMWVRWLLRILSMGAAGFAAHINYQYGLSLAGNGLTAAEAQMVGLGLAAVTMGGPLFFEVRQWVLTLSAAVLNPKQRAEDKARRKHDKARRKDHKDVVQIAKQLVSAAPFGKLSFEDAFARAWAIKHGTTDLGMMPQLHAMAVRSAAELAAAQEPGELGSKAIRQRIEGRLNASDFVLPTTLNARLSATESSQRVTQIPPASPAPVKGARKKPVPPRRKRGDSLPFHPLAKVAAADTARAAAPVNGHHH